VSLPDQPAEAPPRRVLVVDDESQIVRALKVVLREAGFEAVPAETVRRMRRSSISCCPTATVLR